MADTAYHNEALRKARVIERKKAAEMSRGNVPSDGPECFSTYHPDPRSKSGALKLDKFRVNDAGFDNRYRGRAEQAPHVDEIYTVIYPDDTNKDYTRDPMRNNRRRHVQQSNYDIRRKINGEFDMKIVLDSGTAEAQKAYGY